MSKTRDTGFLGNVVKVDSTGNVSFVSGSTTLMSISSSGAVTTTGVISGSNALSSSYALNADQVDGLNSTSFVFTSSYNTDSSSVSTRVTRIEGNYATTGSNVFLGAQTVCANITSTGTIIAQTLNVQQVTSSVVYSSGSNIFGCDLSNVQQFTGSVRITGSLSTVGIACFSNMTCTLGGLTAGCGDLIVDPIGKCVTVGRISAVSGDNSTFVVRDRTDALRAVIPGGGSINTIFRTNSSCFIVQNYSGTDMFRIANDGTGYFSGNVGIGEAARTTSTLVINNTNAKNELTFGGSEYTNIYSETTSGMQFGIVSSGNSAAIEIFTNNAERMRITSCGNVTICTIDNQGGLTVTSAQDNTTVRVGTTATGGQEWRIQSTGGTSGLGQGKLFFKVGTTEAGCNIPLALTTDNGANGARVGIGIVSPEARLHIDSNNASPSTIQILRLLTTRATNNCYGIELRDSSNEVNASIYSVQEGSNNRGSLVFGTNNGTGGNGLGSTTSQLRIFGSGVSCFASTVCAPTINMGGTGARKFTLYTDGVSGTCNSSGFGVDLDGASYGAGAFFGYGTSDNGRFVIGSLQNTTFRSKFTVFGSGVACFADRVCAPTATIPTLTADQINLTNTVSQTPFGLSATAASTNQDVLSIGNERGVWLVSVQGFGGNNSYFAHSAIVYSAAYEKSFTDLGQTNHFGNSTTYFSLSTTSGASAAFRFCSNQSISGGTVFVLKLASQ